MTNTPPAFATMTTFVETPPYDHGSTAWTSTTGTKFCNPAEDTPTYHARECTFVTTSSGIMQLDAEASLWQVDPIFIVRTSAQGTFGIPGDSPVTDCLNNGYFKFRDQHDYAGDVYRSDNSNADGYLAHYFRIYRSSLCNGTWDSSTYTSYQGVLLRAGSPGTNTHFSNSGVLEYTTVNGPVSGYFSVKMENDAVSVAANIAGASAYADFYNNGDPSYGYKEDSIKEFSCTTFTECQNGV